MAEINYPKMALGAWAWGNDGTFGSGIDAADLNPLFDAAMLQLSSSLPRIVSV